MAVTIVFGLATASILVLFVVPALLGMLEDISGIRSRVMSGVRSTATPAE